MNIFPNTRSKIVFAFTLVAHPGETPVESLSMVRSALAVAGVRAVIQQAHDLEDLRECAQRIISIIHAQMLPNQGAALLAKYSRDWEARRAACSGLRHHFAPPLAGITTDVRVVDKLVRKYFLVERDRSASWSPESIADEFGAKVHDVRQAWAVLGIHADQLERAALDALEHALTKELAHA